MSKSCVKCRISGNIAEFSAKYGFRCDHGAPDSCLEPLAPVGRMDGAFTGSADQMNSPVDMTPKASSPSLLAALHHDYGSRAKRYAAWLLRNQSDAEEIVQEAYCRLAQYQSDGRTVDENRFAGLLFITDRNLSIDLLRKRKYRQTTPLTPFNEPLSDGVSDDTAQLQLELDELIEQLPDQWAEALKLRTTGELSYEQISKIMGCTKPQVRTWIYRARNQLADELSRRGWLKISRAENKHEKL